MHHVVAAAGSPRIACMSEMCTVFHSVEWSMHGVAWQVRHFRVVNTGAQAVVCSLAAPLPESSGFGLAPGRFTLPPAPPNGDLPSIEATATLLVRACGIRPCLANISVDCDKCFTIVLYNLTATSTICA